MLTVGIIAELSLTLKVLVALRVIPALATTGSVAVGRNVQ